MPSDPVEPAAGSAAPDTPAAPPLPTPEPGGPAAAPERRCQNCGEPLYGDHCYACGQPTKGLVRHFSSILGDFFDSVFELDSRILRTLGPLMFRPGFLTEEYFAGRRVRYVSPVRLFVFLSIIAFFAASLSLSVDDGGGGDAPVIDVESRQDTEAQIRSATTVAEVERLRDEAVAELRSAKEEIDKVKVPGVAPGVGAGMDIAERATVEAAERRIAAIRDAEARGVPVPAPEDDDEEAFSFNGKPWHPTENPITSDWLPAPAERKLNESVGRVKKNIPRIKEEPDLLKDAFLSTVPTTLFVLLPLFALLLKVVYLFKRRLYMEHLIVALHSHSFLCAGLFVAIVFDAMKGWTTGAVSGLFQGLEIATLAWLPLYLLVMQKRVYRQGWIATLFKYGVLGTCYVFLMSIGAGISFAVSLVSM